MAVDVFSKISPIVYHAGVPPNPGATDIPAIAINTTTNRITHRWDIDTGKWVALYPTETPAATARMVATNLNNPTQATIQSYYDAVSSSLKAPDTVPADVIALANARSTNSYKIYLGDTKWYYTNAATGGPGDWQLFGSGGKSAFTASIDAVFTYR